mmetsp:Transcript_20385/g.42558  ORF Transcript_20385/g.42558 Transcript_20385/m.42558 type:complete len:213 (+) Transcript_20385:452-1090(+)
MRFDQFVCRLDRLQDFLLAVGAAAAAVGGAAPRAAVVVGAGIAVAVVAIVPEAKILHREAPDGKSGQKPPWRERLALADGRTLLWLVRAIRGRGRRHGTGSRTNPGAPGAYRLLPLVVFVAVVVVVVVVVVAMYRVRRCVRSPPRIPTNGFGFRKAHRAPWCRMIFVVLLLLLLLLLLLFEFEPRIPNLRLAFSTVSSSIPEWCSMYLTNGL